MKDISIIIVNWKVRLLLKKCLDSILKYKDDLDIEIFVIDNDSKDGSPKMITTNYPEVNMIALKSNYGFAKANNLGLKRAKGKYLLLLNPDTEITKDFFKKVIKYLDKHTDIGILGPQILNPDKSKQDSVRRFPTFFSQILVLLKLKNILSNNKFLTHYLHKSFDYNKIQKVDQVMGAAFFIRRSVLDKIGLLDENFFIWFEEVDYCQRASKVGFIIKYFPKVSVIHYGGSSFNKQLAFKNQIIFNKSLLRYFKKHKSFIEYLFLLFLIPLNLFLTYSYAIFYKKK